jgi:thiopurine S-methyltransferase
LPDFWDQRFRAGQTPWEAGRVPDALRAFAARFRRPQRALVPGCGSGWEVRFLAESGWDVIGLDFSAAAIDAARGNLGPFADRLLLADYFAFDPGPGFEVIYERTFLCAMPRRLWERYARRTAALLRPGGLLAGYFFFSEEPKGPPFGARPEQLAALFAPWFVQVEDHAVDDSIGLFRGRERWQLWRRRPD